jgi:hypothetical protein
MAHAQISVQLLQKVRVVPAEHVGEGAGLVREGQAILNLLICILHNPVLYVYPCFKPIHSHGRANFNTRNTSRARTG